MNENVRMRIEAKIHSFELHIKCWEEEISPENSYTKKTYIEENIEHTKAKINLLKEILTYE